MTFILNFSNCSITSQLHHQFEPFKLLVITFGQLQTYELIKYMLNEITKRKEIRSN
jgi:spore maturation protein CgeB